LEWAFCVETALRGVGLYSHLTDDPPTLKSDGSNAAAVKSWEISDGKVMAAMVNSVKPTMIMSLRKFKQAKPMWSYLKARYVQDKGALQHTLMQQLHVIEQKDMSIDEYYSAFDRLMGSLISMVPQCTAGETCTTLSFIEQFLTYRFVMGLWVEFDSIRTRLLHASSTLLWPRHCLNYLLKRHAFSPCPLLCLNLTVYWPLLTGGPVHSKNPVSIVGGPIIVQIPVLLRIQRSWLNFMLAVLLVVVVPLSLLEAQEVQALLDQFLLLLLRLLQLLRCLGCLIQGHLFM
jgi:hypothetical protein